MERHSRGKGKKRLLGSHQKCWLWGRHLVMETLAAGRWEIVELFLSNGLDAGELAEARGLAWRWGVTPHVAPPEALERLCHTAEHQGFLARMTDFPYAAEGELMGRLPAGSLSMLLDGVQDPYNLGAIIRSAEVFGVDAIFIPWKGQVGVTSMVARSSAGAVNRVPIVRVDDLAATAAALAERGVAVVAASEKARLAVGDYDFRKSVAIVVGNEGKGVSPGMLERCAATVRIPQAGRIGSLNASVAAGIFCYEVSRQRAGNNRLKR